MISGYLGSSEGFDHAIADFAIAYAGQNEQDYRRLLEAISAGRVLAAGERQQRADGMLGLPVRRRRLCHEQVGGYVTPDTARS